MRLFTFLNRFIPWHRLPTPLAILNLIGLRNQLRDKNLYDTQQRTPPAQQFQTPEPRARAMRDEGFDYHTNRTLDGTHNDLSDPQMGAAGSRFGRNVPLQFAYPETGEALVSPSPRLVSERLLKRDEFLPVRGLNLLAAAWIQMQTHDWFNHGPNEADDPFELPLPPGDDWHENPMRIDRTMRDPDALAH